MTPDTTVPHHRTTSAQVWAFLAAAAAVSGVWFLLTLPRGPEAWVVAMGIVGLYGQGLLLSLALWAGSRLAGGPGGTAEERRRSRALSLIVFAQPIAAALFGMLATLRRWGPIGEAVLVTAKTATLGTVIASAVRVWSGRPAPGLFFAIVLINVLWPLLPAGLSAARWVHHLPGAFTGRSGGWMNPLVTAFWHVPQCAIAAVWLARSDVHPGSK